MKNTIEVLFRNELLHYDLEDCGFSGHRVTIYDSDDEYVDHWWIEEPDEVANILTCAYGLSAVSIDALVTDIAECFDKQIVRDVDEQAIRDLKQTYGEEFINRIGNTVLISE